MKVLMINGSPHADGNTALALREMEAIFTASGVECDTLHIGNQDIRGCIGCRSCAKTGKCVFDDIVNATAQRFVEADGLVVGTPVYYGSANATVMAYLTRLFYSARIDKRMKVGAAVAVARRSGLTATWDEVNKFFGITGMPIATTNYWNNVHGQLPGEAAHDAEGLQALRGLARNMVFLMQSIALGKAQFGLPEQEERIFTNFVR